MALTATITEVIPRKSTVGRTKERKPNFDYLAPELRVLILCQAADLSTIKSLALSCRAYGKSYMTSRRQVLLALVQRTYHADGLPLQLAFQTIQARNVDVYSPDHLDQVQEFFEESEEGDRLSTQPQNSITAKECLELLELHRSVSLICDDVPAHMIPRNPVTGQYQADRASLSTSERFRIMRSIFRWELWSQLFNTSRDGWCEPKPCKESQIDSIHQIYNFLIRYMPWEQEEMGCICDYATRRYAVLCNEAGEYFEKVHPAQVDDIWDDVNAHWILSRKHRVDVDLHALVDRGPRALAYLLENNDPKENCDSLMRFYPSWHLLGFNDLFKAAAKEYLYPFPESYSIKDAPYGWQWARDGDDDFDIEVAGGLLILWHWGFVYWDRERLEEWGIQIGGNVVYDSRKIEMRYQDTGIEIKRKPLIDVHCLWDTMFAGPGWT